MKTNFFSQIANLNLYGDMVLTLKQGSDSTWIVSVLLKNNTCGDSAKNTIPPLIFRNSAEELDKGFFKSLTQPLQDTSELLVNMEAFLKAREQAKKESAMEKEKVEKDKKEKDAREKKCREAMDKADVLEKEGKFREAWSKVPNPQDYPEQADKLKKRKRELSERFAPDLFAHSEKENHDNQHDKKHNSSKV